MPNLQLLSCHIGTINILTLKNLRDHVTMATPPLQNIFRGRVRTVPGACMLNFKSVALDVLELLACSGQKLKVSPHPGLAPFSKTFSGVMLGLSGSMSAKF